MNNVMVVVLQIVALFFVATALSSVLCSLVYTPFRRIILRFAASTRSLATLAFVAIAPAVGLLTVLINQLPTHTQLLMLQHCHGTLCGPHTPMMATATVGGVSLLAGAALLGVGLTTGVLRRVVGMGRRLATVFALSEPSTQHRCLVIDSDQPFAWCCGLLKQRIVISRALVEQTNTAQLELVLAHELAHAQRYDNLRNLAAGWLTRLWPRGQRQAVLTHLAADSEHACDAKALLKRGDTLIFRQLLDITATATTPAYPAGNIPVGVHVTNQRIAAAPGQNQLHPSAAYMLVAAFWSMQFALVATASHPLVEAIAALKL